MIGPVPSRAPLEVLFDMNSRNDDCPSHDSSELSSSALSDLSISQVQNRLPTASSDTCIDLLTASLEKLRIDTATQGRNQNNGGSIWVDNSKNQGRRRLTRPAITANTFDVLETVPEDEPQCAFNPTSATIPSETRLHHLELPASGIIPQDIYEQSYNGPEYTNSMHLTGEKFADHPLVEIARKGVASAEEQVAKHRDGWYEGILSTKLRIEPFASDPTTAPKFREVHFGFNLLPIQDNFNHKNPNEPATSLNFTILITPLAPGQELLADDDEPVSGGNMALAEPIQDHLAPVKEQEALSADGPKLSASPSASLVGSKGDPIESMSPRPHENPVARIEDSVEALDQLEEQLEAFDEAAHFRRIVSPVAGDSESKSPMQSLSVATTAVTRSKTPQPKRTTSVKNGFSSVRINSTSEPRRSVRKAASMIFLDSPKMKSEDKPAAQAPPKKSITKGIASLLPPKQPPRSTKRPTIPTFELPGDEVARKLKEKREARALTQVSAEHATKPTASSLRRAKSAKAPTRPNFELPGEAISRRKREEREAQLKAQEEEERKRREFKARPIRSGAAPSTFPRETIASRARQGKGQLVENSSQQVSPNSNKAASTFTNSTLRSPLSKTNNQAQIRGRELHPEPFGMQPSRGTSSSTAGSMSGKRSSVSTEEAQQQRLRGQEIYKRDNSWAGERERERREREALAKLAREEAAERSRQQSREWAAKQAKKRMTIASLRDVVA